MSYESFMKAALKEAKVSLQEGNHGFGAVVIKDNSILASAHDQEVTGSDPTAHAELTAIRLAAQKCGSDLTDCILVATHEPCPMCATAVVWSGIKTLVYGYSITEAIAEGRTRIDLTCRELFARANANITVHEGVLHDQCSLLYRKAVRDEIKKLRGASREKLESLRNQLYCKRMEWYQKEQSQLNLNSPDLVENAYQLLLRKLEITPAEAPVVTRTLTKIVFHSKNFCPTLEACKILDLDTRTVCKLVNEKPTDALVKQLSNRLEFARNYEKLRPYCEYCEEMVLLAEN